MSYKRLIPIILSLIILLFPFYFFLIKTLSREYSYIIPLIFLTAYFLYFINFIRKEFKNIKADKLNGVQEKTLILCSYDVIYAKNERYNKMTPIPTATFLSYDEDEYIHLRGDFSQLDMMQGKKYKVKYYKNSGLLVDIKYDNSNSRKIHKLYPKFKNKAKPNASNNYDKSNETEYSNDSNIVGYLEVLIVALICAPIFGVLYILYKIFFFIQAGIIMSEGDIMFIQPNFVFWAFAIYGFAILMMIGFERYAGYMGFITKIYNKPGFRNSLIIISAIFLIFLTQASSTYTVISEKGVECNSGHFSKSKTYSWGSVRNASVYFLSERTRRSSYKLKLHYVLELSDGQTIDLKKSDMFWDGILKVNNILKQKHIYIDKGIISFEESISILSNKNINYESGALILSEIMNYPIIGYSSDF